MQLARRTLSGTIGAGLAALVVLSAAAAAPHIHLTASYPAADEVLPASPDTIRLWFSEEPELALAAIGIEGGQGQLEVSDVEATDDPESVRARVLEVLPPGNYRLTWRAAGTDGHVVRGHYAFAVAPDPPDRR